LPLDALRFRHRVPGVLIREVREERGEVALHNIVFVQLDRAELGLEFQVLWLDPVWVKYDLSDSLSYAC